MPTDTSFEGTDVTERKTVWTRRPSRRSLVGLSQVLGVAWGQLTNSQARNVSRFYSICPEEVAEFLGGRLLNFGYWTSECKTQQQAALELVHRLGRLAGIKRGQSLVDVGCGFGGPAITFHEHFGASEVVGVNVTACQVEHANRIAEERGAEHAVRYLQADATDLPVDGRQFDHVVALESAFHFSPRDAFFAEASRVLRPGGCLTIADAIPMQKGAGRWQKALAARLWLFPAANNYGPDEYKERLVQYGFERVEYHSIREQVYEPYVRWTLSQVNVMRLRKLLGWSRAQVYIWQTQLLGRLAANNLLDYALIRAVKATSSDGGITCAKDAAPRAHGRTFGGSCS